MLSLSHVRKTHAGTLVLDDVSLAVPPGSRVGVVGPNGIGKSTLLRVMAGLEEPDSGTVSRTPPSLRVGYLPQQPDAAPEETLLGYVARRTGVAAAEAELDRLSAELVDSDRVAQHRIDARVAQHKVEQHAEALERFLALGGADFRARARTVVAELGLPAGLLDRPLTSLSGGQAARARLAAVLLARFDVFLLDEPTNDLDFDGLDRLERFVDGVEAAVVLVSHDRDFLDRSVERIVELEEGRHRAREYRGGWSEYEGARARARADHYRRFDEVDRRRVELEGLLRRRQGEARAHGRGADRRGTRALASKVRAAERRLDRLDDLEKPWEPWELRLRIDPGARGGDVVVRLEEAIVERGSFRLGPIDFQLGVGDRVALTGPNGSGKSTLIEAILGRTPLAGGRRYVGPGAVLGELDQARRAFSDDGQLLAEFCRGTAVPPEEARSLLARFGLAAADVERRAGSLSPGERTRAAIALLVAGRVNCLVLDEPTNHLDVSGIEELEQALAGYDGTVLLVTHDRRFLAGIGPTRTVTL